MKKKRSGSSPAVVHTKARGRPLSKSLPTKTNAAEPEDTKCVGCGEEKTTLLPLPRDTNPKELFPEFEREKSRGCVTCIFHAIQVRQVREAMSYKLDAFQSQKQCCLVCNCTTGLVPMSSIEGAREAVSHPIINAQNIDKYLKMPCSLCVSCAYPLQWLYNTLLSKKKTSDTHLHNTRKKGILMPAPEPKPKEESKPELKSSIKSGKNAVVKLVKIVDKSESSSGEQDEVPPPRSTRNNRLQNSTPVTPKTTVKTPTKGNSVKTVAALKIAERVQTPGRRSTRQEEIKKEEVKTPVAKKETPKSPKKVLDLAPDLKPELTRTRTRQKPLKRFFDESESDCVEAAPPKKVKVVEQVRQGRPRMRILPSLATRRAEQLKKKAKPAPKRIQPRHIRPSLSPPPPKMSNRRKTELEERICETCQQIFYSGTELALHELRHTGKVLRISLDKFEIPEPVQKLKRSYLFQNPVNLAGPSQAEKAVADLQFDFKEPEILVNADAVEISEEHEIILPEVKKASEEKITGSVKEVPEQKEFEIDSKEDSMDNSASQEVVGNIIDSLEDQSEDPLNAAAPASEAAETKIDESEALKAPLVPKILTFDYFPPSSPKEVRKSVDSCEELKTPPPATASLSSLSFDFFGPDETSPSKSSSMFSHPHVDPAQALKANSDNPSLPLPSDSDNSLILTPPKEVRQMDIDKAIDEILN